EKERALHGAEYLSSLRNGTRELAKRGAELVVWPESSFPYLFDRRLTHEYAPGHPWELRSEFHGTLLFAALTHTFGSSLVYNSAVLTASNGAIAGINDKTRLLEFGEYVPFEERFPEWAKRTKARLPEAPAIEPGDKPVVLE